MQLKTYRTIRGAEAFALKLKAKWPHKLFRVWSQIDHNFRTTFYVEVFVESGDKALWIGVGPLSR